MLLLRGMNPQIIAMDEITQSADADAIRELCCCGVELLATAHARNADELRQRRVFAELLDTELQAGGAVCINTPVFL